MGTPSRKNWGGKVPINPKDSYHIAMTPNADYIKWAGILMESIMMNNPWLRSKLYFHVLLDNLFEEDRKRLKSFSEKWDVSIVLYYMNDDNIACFTQFKNSKKNGKYIHSMYYRWLVPYVVDKEIKKVLYLDVDSVCNKNIFALLEESFEEPILAIKDFYIYRSLSAKRLNMNPDDCFCTGLIHMNIPRIQEEHLAEKVIQILYDYSTNGKDLPLIEQDAANIGVKGNLKIADNLYHYPVILESKAFVKQDIIKGAANAYFVHFLNKIKPWHIEAHEFPCGKVWLDAKMQSAWSDVDVMGKWDRQAYQVAARGAKMNKNYLRWIKYRLLFGILQLKKDK